MCQAHSATACSTVATSGSVRKRQVAENHRVRPMPPTGPRQRAGSAHIIAPPGRASTRSGAATTMSSSCSIMWAVKRCSPSQCSGDTSASASEVQPNQKHAAWA